MKKNMLKITIIVAIAIMNIDSYAINTNTEKIMVLNNKTETFKVYGNCGMCEKTIEGSLNGVKGIEKADWNKETKMMEVSFNEKEITLEEIKKKIAKVGYDTEDVRTTEKAFNNLPGCCQYARPEDKKEDDHKGHQH